MSVRCLNVCKFVCIRANTCLVHVCEAARDYVHVYDMLNWGLVAEIV